MKQRKQLSFTLPYEVAAQLKKLAKEQRRSVSAQAEIILADAVLRPGTKQEASA
jgi:hypothetical protein